MRPTDLRAREQILVALRRGARSNGELAAAAKVSPASIKRILQELGQDIVSGGQTRRRRHALRRQVRGETASLEAFVIGRDGRAMRSFVLDLVQPEGCHAQLDPQVWPQEAGQDGWWSGLPYPLYDMRPQGYLGRIIASHLARQVDIPTNPEEWTDDVVVWYLSHYGADVAGDLIVGQRAMQLWTQQRESLRIIPERNIRHAYVDLAQSAVKLVGAGSSAGGEFPKFTAARSLPGALTPHVIVKFSGVDEGGAARRWADLLVCEHLALQVIDTMQGHCAARSRIIQSAGRTFLESERFDRHGEYGRSAVVTLFAVEAALLGHGPGAWPAVLKSHAAVDLFQDEVVQRVEELWWFGRFIANTDMHHGNLSLRPNGTRFELAPAYDMLPMRYAPSRGGDVPHVDFLVHDLPPPPRDREKRWRLVMRAALDFWRAASRDKRISEAFRGICATNAASLQRWSETWADRT